MQDDTVSFDEMCREVDARRKRELPWTAEDEARREAKSLRERLAREAFEAAHPQAEEEGEEESEGEGEE
jgi:hypothetical protein